MKKDTLAYYLGLVTQVGLSIIFSILIGFLIGLFLDRFFKTRGIFLVLFLIIGVAGGFYNAYKQILRK